MYLSYQDFNTPHYSLTGSGPQTPTTAIYLPPIYLSLSYHCYLSTTSRLVRALSRLPPTWSLLHYCVTYYGCSYVTYCGTYYGCGYVTYYSTCYGCRVTNTRLRICVNDNAQLHRQLFHLHRHLRLISNYGRDFRRALTPVGNMAQRGR